MNPEYPFAHRQHLFDQAVGFHQRGNLAEAERLYLQIAAAEPMNFEVRHLLGILRAQQGRNTDALASIAAALAIRPKAAGALLNYGNVLRTLGRFNEALENYDHALSINPDYPEALYNRAVTLRDLNRYEDALSGYDKTLALKPDKTDALSERGNILFELKRFEEALRSYDKALTIRPDDAETLNSRGKVLWALKRFEEALEAHDKALAIAPGNAEALNNRGNALRCLNRLEEAVESYDAAAVHNAHYAGAFFNRGNTLQDLRRYGEALQSYDRAIEIDPTFAEAHSNKAISLIALDRPEDALLSVDRAIILSPDLAEAHVNRADALIAMNRPEEALLSCDHVIESDRDFAGFYNSRGNALQYLKRFDQALHSYDRAIEINPTCAEAYSNRGLALQGLKRLDEALRNYDQAIEINPDYADAYWNKGLCLLLRGEFDEGWRLYERRKKRFEPSTFRTYLGTAWLGEEDIRGKTLFIYSDQGFGDTIQFCRYALLASASGAKVTLLPQDALSRLLKCLSSAIEIADSGTALPDFDHHISLFSMPLAYKTNAGAFPAQVPYLRVETDRVKKWNDKIGDKGFKIGISWQGNNRGTIDIGRSFPVEQFEPLSKIPDVRLISLQKNDGVEQLRRLPSSMQVEILGGDFDSGPDAFVDSAAVMESLDLVITSDTAIAHLAGALGRPVWVALKYVPDWRWLLDRPDSPWYPSMRLFRQRSAGDWASVFAEMAAQVAALAGSK